MKSALELTPRGKQKNGKKRKPPTSHTPRPIKSSRKQNKVDPCMARQVEQLGKRAVEVDVTPYRSSLGVVISLMEQLKLRDCHKEVLNTTPFWGLFKAIIEGKVSVKHCRKSDNLILRIIRAYDTEERKFCLGTELVELTSGDIRNIFGLCGGNEEFTIKNGSRDIVKMVERRQWKENRLKSTDIQRLVKLYVDGHSEEDIKDVARLLCLYLCHTLFFPASTMVKWVLLERIEDLDRINNYNLCAEMTKEVLASIKKHYTEPWKCSGCLLILLYWLCEHTNIVDPELPNTSPSFLKWSIPALTRKFNTVLLEDLDRSQVIIQLQYNTDEAAPESSKDGICGQGNFAISDIMLPCEQMFLSSSFSLQKNTTEGVNNADTDHCGYDNESTKAPKEMQVVPYSGVHFLLEDFAKTGKQSEGFDDINFPRLGEGQADEIELLREQVAMLISKAISKETEHASEREMKDAEIARLNESVIHLLDENGRLSTELDEKVVHSITQQFTEASNKEEKEILEDAKSEKKNAQCISE